MTAESGQVVVNQVLGVRVNEDHWAGSQYFGERLAAYFPKECKKELDYLAYVLPGCIVGEMSKLKPDLLDLGKKYLARRQALYNGFLSLQPPLQDLEESQIYLLASQGAFLNVCLPRKTGPCYLKKPRLLNLRTTVYWSSEEIFFVNLKRKKVVRIQEGLWRLHKKVADLGEGTFTKAYTAIRADVGEGTVGYCCDHVAKSPRHFRHLKDAIFATLDWNHPNIHTPYRDRQGQVLAMNYLGKGEEPKLQAYEPLLGSDIFSLESKKFSYALWGVFNGLAFLHSSGLVHGDIKGENLLENPANGEGVIIDLGFIAKVNSEGFSENGNPVHRAPEAWNFGGVVATHQPAWDLWGMGILILSRFSRHYDWDMTVEEQEKRYKKLSQNQINNEWFGEKVFKGLPPHKVAFLKLAQEHLLRLDPEERTAAEKLVPMIKDLISNLGLAQGREG